MGNSYYRLLREYVERVNNIYANSKSDSSFNSLHEGMGTCMFLNYYLGCLFEDDSLLMKSRFYFESSIIKTKDGEIKNLYSFAEGLPGICWMISYYSKLINEPVEIDRTIDNLIATSAINSIKQKNVDPLYGGFGGIHYLSTQNSGSKNLVLDDICKKSKLYFCIDNFGMRCRNIILKYQKENEFDIGYAHGLSGLVSILAREIPTNATINYLVNQMLKYIERQYRKGFKSLYPATCLETVNISSEIIKEKYNIRLGWCYGDLSIATMYLTLYKYTGIKEYLDRSLNIAQSTLCKRSRKDSHVNDVFFCHGSSYLAYIYYKFYVYSNDHRFLDASSYWKKDVIQNFAQYMNARDIVSYLNSLSGAIFVLLYLNESNIIRDDFFQSYLLNI